MNKLNKNIKIFYGGPHASLNVEECLSSFDFIDAIVLGEAEKSVLPMVDKLMDNEIPENIKGIAYKKEGKINKYCFNDMLSNEELKNSLLKDYDIYEFNNDELINIEGGRGCPYNCTFCSTSIFWGRKYRVIDTEFLVSNIS